MPKFVSRELAGWGRFPVQNCLVARPEKQRELLETVQSREVVDIIARGLGRSYGDAALNQGSGVLLQEKLNRFLSFDALTGTLHAQGGACFADIVETFVPRGFFLSVAPGVKNITLGGAIAADVHGKNHHRIGAISSFVDEIELLTASGNVLMCSREQHAGAFWATLGGMGLTGIITSAKLRLMPIESAWIDATYTRTPDLDATLGEFENHLDAPYLVAWIDCLARGKDAGRSVVSRGQHAGHSQVAARIEGDPLALELPKKKGVPLDLPDFVLNPTSVAAFNHFYYARHPDAVQLTSIDAFFYPLDAIENWNRIYGKRGFVQYQCAVPLDNARAVLGELLETISASGQAAFLAVLKRMGPQDDAPLSFPLEGYSLALDLPFAPGVVEFCHRLDEKVIEAGGRIYLAKDSVLQAGSFRKMYPRLVQFEAAKRQLDPDDRFASSLSRRLGIGI